MHNGTRKSKRRFSEVVARPKRMDLKSEMAIKDFMKRNRYNDEFCSESGAIRIINYFLMREEDRMVAKELLLLEGYSYDGR